MSRPLAALLVPTLQMGGGERITLALADELHRTGAAVDVVVGDARGPLRDEVPDGVPLVDLGCPRWRSAAAPLLQYVLRRRPACLVPTVEHASVLALAVGGVTGTPVVVRVANTLSALAAGARGRQERLLLRVAARTYRRAAAVVACSEGMADDAAQFCGLSRDAVVVVPNATVTRALPALARAPLEHPWFAAGEPPVVVSVGRLAPQKNQRLLLDAIALVRRSAPVRLVVLGEGPEREALTAHAEHLGIGDAVDLKGVDPNPYRYMSRSSAFVLSSDWEGLPGVLIEALACGSNVVATDCPSGPREILAGGAHGRLVPPGDPQALADAVHLALVDPVVPPCSAVRPYTAESVASRYRTLLEDVVR